MDLLVPLHLNIGQWVTASLQRPQPACFLPATLFLSRLTLSHTPSVSPPACFCLYSLTCNKAQQQSHTSSETTNQAGSKLPEALVLQLLLVIRMKKKKKKHEERPQNSKNPLWIQPGICQHLLLSLKASENKGEKESEAHCKLFSIFSKGFQPQYRCRVQSINRDWQVCANSRNLRLKVRC